MEAAGRENMIQNSAVRDRIADADNEARMPKEESRGLAGWLAGKYNRLYIGRLLRPGFLPHLRGILNSSVILHPLLLTLTNTSSAFSSKLSCFAQA